MTVDKLLRWWPPIAIVAMMSLGYAVGKGSTAPDRAVAHGVWETFGWQPRWLLAFTDWRLLVPVLLVCVAVALYRRRWPLAAVVALCPLVAIGLSEVFKHLFGRVKGGPSYLSYPSGHTTLVVSVMGMLVLVAAGALWSTIVAVTVSVLGLLGQIACGYHYFTDTVGAVFMTTAVVCLAALLAGQSASSSARTSSDRSTLV